MPPFGVCPVLVLLIYAGFDKLLETLVIRVLGFTPFLFLCSIVKSKIKTAVCQKKYTFRIINPTFVCKESKKKK